MKKRQTNETKHEHTPENKLWKQMKQMVKNIERIIKHEKQNN